MSDTLTVTLQPQDAAMLARWLVSRGIEGFGEREMPNGLEIDSREMLADLREKLDIYESELEVIEWGESAEPITVHLPLERLKAAAEALIDWGSDVHSNFDLDDPRHVACLRRCIAERDAGVAIAELIGTPLQPEGA